MNNTLPIYWLLLTTIAFVSCRPQKNGGARQRNKRQFGYPSFGDDDSYLMRELWDKPVGLGFFVNSKGDADDSDTARMTRDKIEAGSGAVETKRDQIEKASSTVFAEEKKPESNSEETELTGEIRSKIEKSPSDEDQPDLGDKKKVKSSVTCQDRKEWIQCDGPYELIKISDAFWGRDDNKTCTKSDVTHGGLRTDKNCVQDAENTMKKVREACDNENVCEVVASDIYFDKTDCPDVHKFLRLKWQCAPSESRIKESTS